MTLGAHLMQQAVGQRHGMVLPPQRVSLSMADADIVHYGVPRKIDSPWESASGGVARRERDARLAAIGEAVERTTSGLVQLPMRPRCDIPPCERIDAEDFALFTPDQRARPGFPHGSIHDPECPYVEVFSLFDNSPTWVPQPFVSLQDPHRTGVPNSSGLAAGPDAHAALLRGSSSAIESNRVCVEALREGLRNAGVSADAVALVEGGREVTGEMMAARGLVDVLIPRGGAGLINAVVEGAKVPVIETGTGNCHLYVDASADIGKAVAVLLNAKTQRPSVCNAVETLLVHRDIAGAFLPVALDALRDAGVTVHGTPDVVAFADDVVPAGEDEFDAEYLSLDLAVRIVADIDEAVTHIRRHTTGHSETVITESRAAADRFVTEIDAAAVLVNASSRFVDGGQFGFGAEIGISTQKLHARGPMGLAELTSTKYIVNGDGQVRV